MQTLLDFSDSVDSHSAGEQRKDAAHLLMSVHRERLIRCGQRLLLEILLSNGRATADDVRDRLEIPEGINPKFVGAIPGPLAKLCIIAPDGFEKSRRAIAHARPNRVWRLRDESKARHWLAAHPELPDSEAKDEMAVAE